jgi:hypothetical protein
MNKLKFILPLILATITLVTYRPIEAQASTTITPQFINNFWVAHNDGTIYPNPNFNITEPILVPNNITINNHQFVSALFVFNESTYIGGFWTNNTFSNDPKYLGNITQNIVLPQNATHIRLGNSISNSTWSPTASLTNFQSVTVSYSNPAPADPFTDDPIPSNLSFAGNLDTFLQNNYKVDKTTGQLTPDSNYNYFLFSLASENPYVSNRPTDLNEYDAYISFYDWEFNYISSSDLTNTNINQLNNFPSNARYAVKSYEKAYLPSNVQPTASSWNAEGSPKIIFLDYDGSIKYQNYFQKPSDAFGPAVAGYIQGEPFTDYFPGPTALQAQEFIGWVPITILQPTSTIDLPIGLTTNSYTPDINANNVVTSLSNAQTFRSYYVYPLYEELVTYTVTFLDYDGTVLGTDTVVDGFPANPPLIPTRTGYTFTGWQPPIAEITGDITTVAQYTPNTYLITWNSDGVEVKANQEAHDSVILDHAPFVTYEGYVFIGWKIDPTETLVTSGQIVTGPLSLTAVWEEATTYTVIWRSQDLSTIKIEYVVEGGFATPPVNWPGSGFIFLEWLPDINQPITQNTTFTGFFEPAPVTPPPTTPENYSPISDLFGGVIGASIGAIMTLGTIELYGITLNSLIFLFVSMSLGLWILKAIRG